MKAENPYRPSFGSKELRFDGQLELKEYFNRDPGPGTYNEQENTVENSLSSELKAIKNMAKHAALQKKDINIVQSSFLSKQKKFIPVAGTQTTDPLITVGPGQYDPQAPQKHMPGPTMDYKGDFSLPFNEKNPLNYVKPITVNIYFK